MATPVMSRDRTGPRTTMRWTSGTLNEHWYIAATSSEVTARRPLGRTVMEEAIVLWRDGDGRVVAMVDRCLHRNAQLSHGDLFDGKIGCPYHGWTYDRDGHCVSVPSEGPPGDGYRPCAVRRQLETYPVREQDGFVWVYMGTAGRASERTPFRFPDVAPGWSSYVMVTQFAGDVTDLVENFMDVPHTAFVHRGWFRRPTPGTPGSAVVQRTADAVHVTYDRPDDVIGFAARLVNPDRAPVTHTDRFFMPNCTRVDYRWGPRRHFIITSQITPLTPDRATVYTAITFTFGGLTRAARMVLPAYTRAVINQDVAIMANQTANLRRFGGRAFHGTEADVIHEAIEALRAAALAGERHPAPAARTDRVTFWM